LLGYLVFWRIEPNLQHPARRSKENSKVVQRDNLCVGGKGREDGRQRTEDRRQKTEYRRRNTEDGKQKTENRSMDSAHADG
ncbi:MAG TPA: hypothetical protein PLT92_04345, partial [Ignavibacteriaceae bacterium]|nr:hypothetical protein [Ignavibacteriaceae bacterium]